MVSRIWLPTQAYSSRGGSAVRLIVFHTTEGAQDFYSLGTFFANTANQVSSHVGIDNLHSGLIGEYVSRDNKAWTQGEPNPYCLSAELCTPKGAAAGWSSDYWLGKQGVMLANAAAWLAQEAAHYGIPLVSLTASQAQSGSVGVCDHVDLGASGGGHYDCGPGFPMDYVIQLAKGGTPITSEADMIPAVATYNNHDYYAWVDKQGRIVYRGPDTNNAPVVIDSTAGAIGGCGMSITPSGWTFVTFLNNDGDPYVDRRGPGGEGGWQRFKLGDT